MRYLITGAAGFIGSHFVRELMAGSYDSLGHECTGVTVFDKLTYAGNQANLTSVADDPRYTFVHGDICDGAVLDPAVPLVDLRGKDFMDAKSDRSVKKYAEHGFH
mgnify:CR=1 FL=1